MDASFEAGYGSSSRAYEDAREFLGMSPASYGAGGKDAVIAFSTGDSALGRLLVAGTERGVCFVAVGENDAELESALRTEFPMATLCRDDARINEWRDVVAGDLSDPRTLRNLPLDVRATDFQRRVWRALCEIPRGETRTYKDIAVALGAPNAVRAVGAACGANPVALIIPCHRAIGSDGRLHGYRWGLDRKQWLLERERRG